jgi:hypothetical protein
MGWCVKKSLMGKTVYNDAGTKVRKVEDLIIAPDKNLTYVIVGAGGFVGIGRHDVAIPVAQIQGHAGKLVMPGATKDSIKAMPEFAYVNDTARRDAFIANAEKDISRGKTRQAELEKRAGVASAATKGKITSEIAGLEADVKSAEARLDEMKAATAARWKEFEAGVNAATAKLRKSSRRPPPAEPGAGPVPPADQRVALTWMSTRRSGCRQAMTRLLPTPLQSPGCVTGSASPRPSVVMRLASRWAVPTR